MIIALRSLFFAKALKKDCRGVVAVEFAITCPILVVLLVGIIEVTNLMMCERRVLNVASTVGDLIAQGTDISSSEMNDIILGGRYVMKPFDENNLTIGVVSVRYNDTTGAAYLGWGSTASYNSGSVSNPTTKAAGLGQAGESVIIVTVTYTFSL